MRRSADSRLKQPKSLGDSPRLKQPKALGDSPRLKQPKALGDSPRLKQPQALGDSPDAPSDQPLPVRYYPRRVRSGRSRRPLTPSQALHLASDPHRAALAARTAEQRELVVPAPVAGGRLRGWFTRLVQRSSRAR